MVDADEDKLTQVFFNLIRNAVEISPKGKNILVITRISRDFGLKPTYTRKAGMHIVVEIIDNGPGILKENLKKTRTNLGGHSPWVFESPHQRKTLSSLLANTSWIQGLPLIIYFH